MAARFLLHKKLIDQIILRKDVCQIKIRSNYFSSGKDNMWNSLPADMVNAPFVNRFKNCLDNHWVH